MSRRGRPRTLKDGRIVSTRLDGETVASLERIARERGVSRSVALRDIVREAVRDIVESDSCTDTEGR